MALAAPELIILMFLMVPVLTVLALADLLRRPADAWRRSGQDRLVWALVVVFVGVIGPVLYLTIGRSRLERASGRVDATIGR